MMHPEFYNSAIVKAPHWIINNSKLFSMQSFCVRWCFYHHPDMGPMIIDTGYSQHVLHGSHRRIGLKLYAALLRPKLVEQGQISNVLYNKGITCDDIKWVILTHFHADHISAAKLFPNAQFIISRDAFQDYQKKSRLKQWTKGIFEELLPKNFNERLQFIEEKERKLLNNNYVTYKIDRQGDILALPLPGHAAGHFGLVWPHLNHPLIYAVDTEWLMKNITSEQSKSLGRLLVFDHPQQALSSIKTIQQLQAQGFQTVLCHDTETNFHDC